jgi:predicted glycosyltransferase
LPVCILPSVDDTPSYIAAADLVVAMAGYNTTVEILRSGRRAILIPRPRPSAEQRMRARLFAAHGWVTMIDPDDLGVENVSQTVLKSLGQEAGTTPAPAAMVAGVSRVVEQLLALLQPGVSGLAPVAPSAGGPRPEADSVDWDDPRSAPTPATATEQQEYR